MQIRERDLGLKLVGLSPSGGFKVHGNAAADIGKFRCNQVKDHALATIVTTKTASLSELSAECGSSAEKALVRNFAGSQ